MSDNYQSLLGCLTKARNDNWIILLYRGVNMEFAFEKVNLDIKYNTIEQFAEKLFFFGEKSKYFWNNKINPANNKLLFDINDISGSFFEYIFKEFNSLIKQHHFKRTFYYFKKNKNAVSFFENPDNSSIFISVINRKTKEQKVIIRNYYLTILHQLGESKYKQTSQFISGSTDEMIANKFSRNEIVINFWELNFNKGNIILPDNNIPLFKGKPYKNQKELTVFTVILPQFIYSFKFRNKIYKNPAIENIENFATIPLTGLDIQQDNFKQLLITETNYSAGVTTEGSTYKEIN